MCTSPLLLRNRFAFVRSIPHSLSDFDNIHMPSRNYLRVPCGHCPECLQAKKDSFFIRCRDEYHYNNKRAIFLTLTYDRKSLPTTPYISSPVFDNDGNIVKDGCSFAYSHWSRKHISTYTKKINEKIIFKIGKSLGLTRLHHGSLTDEWLSFVRKLGRPIKYLCVCERGSADIYVADNGRKRFGTARPHYHLIIFVCTDRISLDDVISICKSSWSYGISYPLKIKNAKGKFSRDDIQCIDYVTKYVTKENTSTYKNVDISSSDILFQSDKSRSDAYPFVSISNFVGFSQFASLSPDYIFNTLVTKGYQINTGKSVRSVNIPQYYLNKLNYVNTKKYVPSYPQINVVKTFKLIRCISPFVYDIKDYSVPNYFIAKVRYKRHCRYHSVSEHQWDTSNYPPIHVCSYKRALPVSTSYNYPTSFGQQFKCLTLDNKVDFISTLFNEVKESPNLINYYYEKKYSPLSKVGDVDTFSRLVAESCVEDIQNFVYHSLDNDISSPFQLLYDYLIAYNSTKTIGKRIEREYKYKSNLSKSINQKPELFNVCPLK